MPTWQIRLVRHQRRWVLLRNWCIRPEIGQLATTLHPSAHVLHLDDANLDPRTWCRFPILSGGYATELAELEALVK